MRRREREETNRWRERPLLGASLQATLIVVPLIVGIAAGLTMARWLPADRTGSHVVSWGVSGTTAMITVWILQPLVRRAVPLAWLLRLGMLWPGTAPSRFKIARRAGRVRDLEARLARAREQGLKGDPIRAAELILTLIAALTSHDRRTRGHAERVRVFTDLLALETALDREERDRLRWSALLHDIGKLEVPERVLNKPGKPSPREWEQLKAHPAAGDRIIAPLRDWLGEWADATLHHHERWDGGGYPNGLAGREISRAGRIVAVADAYEVMTAARSYKRPMSAAAARQELVACAAKQFDPSVVRAFLLVPIWRLRWALGPFAWVAQLPLAREVVHASRSLNATPLAGAVGTTAGAVAIMMGSNLHPALGSTSTAEPSASATDNVEVAADNPLAVPDRTSPDRQLHDSMRPLARSNDSADGRGDRSKPPEGQGSDEPSGDSADVVSDEQATNPDERKDDTSGTVTKIVDDTSGTVGKVVDDTSGTVGKVVDDTSGTVGKVVDDTSGTVGKVVDDTSGTVGKVVDDTSGTVGKVVDDTSGTVGKVADDTTGTVGKVVADDTTGTVRSLLGG